MKSPIAAFGKREKQGVQDKQERAKKEWRSFYNLLTRDDSSADYA
jgi:hypothetical protein